MSSPESTLPSAKYHKVKKNKITNRNPVLSERSCQNRAAFHVALYLSNLEDKISIWTIQHVGLDSSDPVYRLDVSHERLSSLRKSEPRFFWSYRK